MTNFFKKQNINLDSIFQVYSPSNATQAATLSSSVTKYTNNNIDINTRYAGRDNRVGNWVSSATFYKIFGSDISNNFNRFGAEFILTIGGNYTYDKISKTPTLSFSPTNVVTPNISTRINAGTYTCSTLNSTTTVAVGTNIPASYVPIRSGSMIINPRPISFTFSGSSTFTGDPISVTSFITVGGGLPAGVGYTVSPSTVTSANTYNNTSFTITITGDSASNYSITKSGSFTINPQSIDLVILGEAEYTGSSFFPSIFTVPSGYESNVGVNAVTDVGEYNSGNLSITAGPNVIINSISGSYYIYTRVIVNISFPGIAVYNGPTTSYLPDVTSVTSLTGAPIPPEIVSGIYPTTPKTYPGVYPGSSFSYTGYTILYREYSYTGSMTIVNFSGSTDLTQTVNGTGSPGNTINLTPQSVSPSLPPGISYSASITDPGPNYPAYVSGSSASLTINGDSPSYYNITQTGTITIFSPPT
jgi:hypothetical protein